MVYDRAVIQTSGKVDGVKNLPHTREGNLTIWIFYFLPINFFMSRFVLK